MTEWDLDPVFAEIRNEFINSFARRLESLKIFTLKGASKSLSENDISEIRVIVHNLAGVAQSYGFATLSRIAGALDDLLSFDISGIDQKKLVEYVMFLNHGLSLAIRLRNDPSEILEDSRMEELTSVVLSLRGEAKF